MLFGISSTLWSQALIAEVYSMNVMFFFLIFSLCIRYDKNPSDKLLAVIMFIYGLSLSNFFREKTKIFVRHKDVYDKLLKYHVPKDMISYNPLQKEAEKEKGLEEGLAPSTA